MTKPKIYYGFHVAMEKDGQQLNLYGSSEPVWAVGETRAANLDSVKRPSICNRGYHVWKEGGRDLHNNLYNTIWECVDLIRNKENFLSYPQDHNIVISYSKLTGQSRCNEEKVCSLYKTVLAKAVYSQEYFGDFRYHYFQLLNTQKSKVDLLLTGIMTELKELAQVTEG